MPAVPRSPFRRWVADVDDWCAGRWWLVRVPVLVFLAWIWVRHAQSPTYQSIFKGLNLGIHELGHYVFGPFGDIPGVLGGSLFQCLVPMIAVAMFVRQRDWFAVFFAFGWLGTNYFDVAVYAGDAVAKRLPLVTPGGGEPIHDWNYILGYFGWLRYTDTAAAWHRAAAHLCMAISLAGGTWVTSRMFAAAQRAHAARAAGDVSPLRLPVGYNGQAGPIRGSRVHREDGDVARAPDAKKSTPDRWKRAPGPDSVPGAPPARRGSGPG